MRIQHNIAALNSYRQLSNNNNSVSKNLEKLSSGFRINRAGDDAAGLAISEKMRAQITGLETAQKNANDGISLVQTAEGALTEVHSMLNRMVELAGQSANGTYDNETDRANLQKEVQSLKDEINRISEGTNFNGINLLDGSVNEAHGINLDGLSMAEGAAITSEALGTQEDTTDGILTKGVDAVNYSAKIYLEDITNNDTTNPKNIVFDYKDNAGNAKTVTIEVKAGGTATAEDIVAALTSGSSSGDITQVTDSGTASAATGGEFKDLFNVSLDGNVLTVSAKEHDTQVGTSTLKIDGTKLNGFGLSATTDIDLSEANAAIQDATGTLVEFGDLAGDVTDYVAGTDTTYQVASSEFKVGGTGAESHNKGIKIGNRLYVIQSGNEELKGADDAVIVKVLSGDNAQVVAEKLAAAITLDESNNGNYVAAAGTGGELTISESTNRAQDVLDGKAEVGKGASITSNAAYTLTPATIKTSGNLSLDASKIVNGSTITVGDKVYMLTNDSTMNAPKDATKVVYGPKATTGEVAQALADAMTADGLTGVTANPGGITFADTAGEVSTVGNGLTLQIGDTAQSFNQMSVKINSTSTTALGIDGIDISTQTGAKDAINVIKDAVNSVSSNRGDLGAIQNRLEHTINNLGVTSENMTAAESRIRDVDMAKEMMAYTKNNILVQASQAMLAQANQIPQGVLQLLQ